MGIRRYVPSKIKKYLKPLYPHLLSPPTSFIILTRGRTGSTLFLTLLNNHHKIRIQNEIFGQILLETSGYQTKINEQGAPAFLDKFFERQDLESAVGAKILYHQIEEKYAEKFAVPSLVDVPSYLRRNTSLRIVHLKRRNYLDTITSWKLALQTNQWVRLSNDGVLNDEIQIHISPEECMREFSELEQWERKYDLIFQDHLTKSIYYEDMVREPQEMANKIFDFLKVERVDVTPGTKKQTSKDKKAIIANYTELKKYFQYTRWSKFFN